MILILQQNFKSLFFFSKNEKISTYSNNNMIDDKTYIETISYNKTTMLKRMHRLVFFEEKTLKNLATIFNPIVSI
jgi:hypothetical protein